MVVEVFFTLRLEAVHRWPEADGVSGFLKYPHRHLFYIKGWAKVQHDDRDIEFIRLRREVADYLNARPRGEWGMIDLGAMSCEMLAQELLVNFGLSRCEVSEDDQNGAVVTL